MKQQTLLKLASQSILKNKMRTLLTMLGIVIGVGAVIVMVAIGNGAQASIQDQIKSLGTNVIMIMPGATQQGGASQGAGTFNRLTVQDAEKVKRDATTLAAVSPVIQTRTQVIGGNGNWRTQINGVSTDYLFGPGIDEPIAKRTGRISYYGADGLGSWSSSPIRW